MLPQKIRFSKADQRIRGEMKSMTLNESPTSNTTLRENTKWSFYRWTSNKLSQNS